MSEMNNRNTWDIEFKAFIMTGIFSIFLIFLIIALGSMYLNQKEVLDNTQAKLEVSEKALSDVQNDLKNETEKLFQANEKIDQVENFYDKSIDEIIKEISLPNYFVTVKRANVYFPMDYIIGYVSYGQCVKLISLEGTYARILYDGNEAFIKASELISEEYLLAQLVYAEAGICGELEMAKAGKVALNRVHSDYYEFANVHNLMQVLSQEGQYPTTWKRIQNGIQPSAEAIKIAQELLSNNIDVGFASNVLWQTGFDPIAKGLNVWIVDQTEYHYYSKFFLKQ